MRKPTIEEVREYMHEKDFFEHEEPEKFHDYHESAGWMVGKKKMKCWKGAVRTWIRNAKKWSKAREESKRISHADRQRQQAIESLRELEEMECRNSQDGFRAVC